MYSVRTFSVRTFSVRTFSVRTFSVRTFGMDVDIVQGLVWGNCFEEKLARQN